MGKKHLLAKLAFGTGVSAVLAAGTAAFFFTQTKSGKQAAKKIKGMATEVSKDITARISQLKKMTQSTYDDLVDEVVDEYAVQKKIGKDTVRALKRDLKKHWKEVKQELNQR